MLTFLVCTKRYFFQILFVVPIVMLHFYWFYIGSNLVRKMSFYIGAATVIVFTLLMIPTSHNYHLFAFFKVSSSFSINRYKSQCNFFCKGCSSVWNVAAFSVAVEYFVRNLEYWQTWICYMCSVYSMGCWPGSIPFSRYDFT